MAVRYVLGRWVRDLSPGYFALVMATGILSQAAHVDGASVVSAALLVVALLAYVLLIAAYGGRLVRYRREVAADVTDPVKAFAYLTLVAGSNVLGARLAAAGQVTAAVGFFALAGIAWVVLGYGIPGGLIARHGPRPALAGANGTWFMGVVGTQSVAVAVAALPPSKTLAAVAVICWSIGVVLYLLTAALVLAALLLFGGKATEVTPPYWVFMGATAISVLAGASLLRLPADPLLVAVRPVVVGLCVVLWAFGTWLIPALVAVGVWRHLVRRVRLRYHPDLWSIVFPIGMYGVASEQLGTVLDVHWLHVLGLGDAWAALGVWVIVFAGMLGTVVSTLRSTTGTPDRG